MKRTEISSERTTTHNFRPKRHADGSAYVYEYLSVYAYAHEKEKPTCWISIQIGGPKETLDDGSSHRERLTLDLKKSDAVQLLSELVDELPPLSVKETLESHGWGTVETPDEKRERERESADSSSAD